MAGIFEKIMANAENAASSNISVSEGDYIEDGLIYCGKCKTPKQTKFTLFGEVRTPMCLCKCEAERLQAEQERGKQAERVRRQRERRAAGFADPKLMTWTFANDDMSNEKITKAMLRYVENFPEFINNGKGLLLWGVVGTGKTYAACEVANELIDRGYSVCVTNFSRLTNLIQEKFEGRQAFIDSLNKYDLIVIDDLGAERKSEFMQEMVFTIIDSRYRAGLPMIVTTNLTIDEIKNADSLANSRIYERVLERCFPIEVKGVNRRRQAVRDSYDHMKDLLGV